MLTYYFDDRIIKIYNGTHYDISLYNSGKSHPDENGITCERKRVCLHNKPLEVKSADVRSMLLGDIEYQYTNKYRAIHQFEGYEKYDVIIVSDKYADAVRNMVISRSDERLVDYVDRLYYADVCYHGGFNKTEEKRFFKLLETTSLQKVTNFQNIPYYIDQLKKERSPSLVAMLQCLWFYMEDYNSMDHALRFYTDDFDRRLDQVIRSREATLEPRIHIPNEDFNV